MEGGERIFLRGGTNQFDVLACWVFPPGGLSALSTWRVECRVVRVGGDIRGRTQLLHTMYDNNNNNNHHHQRSARGKGEQASSYTRRISESQCTSKDITTASTEGKWAERLQAGKEEKRAE